MDSYDNDSYPQHNGDHGPQRNDDHPQRNDYHNRDNAIDTIIALSMINNTSLKDSTKDNNKVVTNAPVPVQLSPIQSAASIAPTTPTTPISPIQPTNITINTGLQLGTSNPQVGASSPQVGAAGAQAGVSTLTPNTNRMIKLLYLLLISWTLCDTTLISIIGFTSNGEMIMASLFITIIKGGLALMYKKSRSSEKIIPGSYGQFMLLCIVIAFSNWLLYCCLLLIDDDARTIITIFSVTLTIVITLYESMFISIMILGNSW